MFSLWDNVEMDKRDISVVGMKNYGRMNIVILHFIGGAKGTYIISKRK